MLQISESTISASITGFENPTLPFLDKTLSLNDLLMPSPSCTHIVSAPNNVRSRGIDKGDWLIVNASLKPQHGDCLYAVSDDTYGVTTYERLMSSGAEGSNIHLVGIIQQSIHFYRSAPEVPEYTSLSDTTIHSMLVEKEHTTVLAKASGESMMPYVYDGDLMLIERHHKWQDNDVCVVALNGDLVLKRVNSKLGQLSSDNPRFAPYNLSASDNISIEGTVNKVIRLHRQPCIV